MSSGGSSSAETRRCDFFISRAGESKKWALWVARQLQLERYSVLYQERDFVNGENIVVEMGNATTFSERTLVILSDQYFSSPYTEIEYTTRLAAKELLLFRVSKIEPRPELRPFKFSDLFNLDEKTARQTLLEEIRLAYGEPKYPWDGDIPAAEFPAPRIPIASQSPAATSPAFPAQKVSSDVLENVAYLCDRLQQENCLGAILTNACCRRTVICIAHGDETERVDRFAQRLHTYSVPKYVAEGRVIRPYSIEWPKVTRGMTVNAFQKDLEMAAFRAHLAMDLQDSIAVVRTNLLVSDACAEREQELLQAYVDFWQKVNVPANSLLLVCLMVRYPAERGLGILKRFLNSRSPNDAMRAVLSEETAVRDCHVLPPLCSVERDELDGWIELAEVQQYRVLTTQDILHVYDDDRIKKIPMGQLAPKLVELLTFRKEARS